MEYLVLAIAVSFTVANSFSLRKFQNRDIRNVGDSLLFNAGISVIWVVIVFVWGLIANGGWVTPTPTAALYGVFYGLNLSMFLLFKCQSITTGPVSLSSLIGACGFIIATIFSTIYYHESLDVIQIIGMVVMVVSIYLCISPKKGEMKLTAKWKVYAFLFFCTGGMIGVINKLFQNSEARAEIDAMLLVASATAAVALTVLSFAINKAFRKPTPKITVRNLFYVGLCGLFSCVYQRLNVFLAGALPGVILFPVSNGFVIFASAVGGVLFFKEKLSLTQKLGIVFGFISIVLIGCF